MLGLALATHFGVHAHAESQALRGSASVRWIASCIFFPLLVNVTKRTKHFVATRNPISKSRNDSQEHLNSTTNIGNETLDFHSSTYVGVNESAYCNPDERPKIHSPKSLHRARFNFRLVQSDATCVDGSNLDYQFGVFEPVQDSTECAELCVNRADMRLQPHLVGLSFLCNDQECQCLYPAGALNEQNTGRFNRTNWGTSGRKGTGPINNYTNTTRANAFCFNLISRNFF